MLFLCWWVPNFYLTWTSFLTSKLLSNCILVNSTEMTNKHLEVHMYCNPTCPIVPKTAPFKSFSSHLIATLFFSCSGYPLDLSIAAQEKLLLDPLSKHIYNSTIIPVATTLVQVPIIPAMDYFNSLLICLSGFISTFFS